MTDTQGAVRHESQGGKGMFFVQDGGQRIAEMTYARAEGVRIRPVCGCMRKGLDTTPDYADMREPSSS